VERLLDLAVDVRAVLAAQRLRLVTRERHVQGCQGAVAGAVRLGLQPTFVTGVRTAPLQQQPVAVGVEVAVLVADLAAAGHPGMEGPLARGLHLDALRRPTFQRRHGGRDVEDEYGLGVDDSGFLEFGHAGGIPASVRLYRLQGLPVMSSTTIARLRPPIPPSER